MGNIITQCHIGAVSNSFELQSSCSTDREAYPSLFQPISFKAGTLSLFICCYKPAPIVLYIELYLGEIKEFRALIAFFKMQL